MKETKLRKPGGKGKQTKAVKKAFYNVHFPFCNSHLEPLMQPGCCSSEKNA